MYLLALILVPLVHYAYSLPYSVAVNQLCPVYPSATVDLIKLDGKWFIYAATPMQLPLDTIHTVELKGECASVAFQHQTSGSSTAVNITQWIDHKENVFYTGLAEQSTATTLQFIYSEFKVAYNVIDVNYTEYAVLYWCKDASTQSLDNPVRQIEYNLLTLVRKPQPTDEIKKKIEELHHSVHPLDANMTKFLNKEEDCKPKPLPTDTNPKTHTNETTSTTPKVTSATTPSPPPSTTTPPPTTARQYATTSTTEAIVESTTQAKSEATNMVPTSLALVSVAMSILRKL